MIAILYPSPHIISHASVQPAKHSGIVSHSASIITSCFLVGICPDLDGTRYNHDRHRTNQ
jgi:hypothetical protein